MDILKNAKLIYCALKHADNELAVTGREPRNGFMDVNVLKIDLDVGHMYVFIFWNFMSFLCGSINIIIYNII